MTRWQPPTFVPAFAIAAAICLLTACQSQQVIYRTVPSYQLREGLVPERYVRDDGVLVINRPRSVEGIIDEPVSPDQLSGRVEDEDGEQTMHALVPEQVIANLMHSILQDDYQFIWDQILSQQTRSDFEQEGGGFDDFVAYFEANRNDLYAMLNRMSMGIHGREVLVERGAQGAVRLRFQPHFAKEFQFSTVDMVWEDFGLKLLEIHPTYTSDES